MIIAVLIAAALTAMALTARRGYAMVTVDGPSMQPALKPGDRVLIRRHRLGRIRASRLVVARKPCPGQRWDDPDPVREADPTWLIKRVADADPAGGLWLLGDNAAQSWDSRQWGRCPPAEVHGLVIKVFRQERSAPGRPPPAERRRSSGPPAYR